MAANEDSILWWVNIPPFSMPGVSNSLGGFQSTISDSAQHCKGLVVEAIND